MKKIILNALLLLSCSAVYAQIDPVKQFSFLLGSWEMKTKTGKTTEHWKSGINKYAGSSYKHNVKGDSTLTETISLKKINGIWHFCVTGHEQSNLGTTNFKLVSTTKNTFVFENAKHDFPQRIVYQNSGGDKLIAWIEGKINGKAMKIHFAYQRKK
jgi:hypothetical protein